MKKFLSVRQTVWKYFKKENEKDVECEKEQAYTCHIVESRGFCVPIQNIESIEMAGKKIFIDSLSENNSTTSYYFEFDNMQDCSRVFGEINNCLEYDFYNKSQIGSYEINSYLTATDDGN